MGRRSTIDETAVFASVGNALAENGVVSLQDVVDETGVSIGSLYNRYGSREGLMAQVWLDAVGTFQDRFLLSLTSGKPDAGLSAALATPKFCRDDPARATILATCRKSEFLNEKTPPEFQKAISNANRNARQAISAFARSERKALETCRLALVAFPLGAVRLYLPDQRVPKSVDEHIRSAYHAVMSA